MRLITKTLLAVILTGMINYAFGQNYLTFTAEEANVEIGMTITGTMGLPNIEFSFDQTNWREMMKGQKIILANPDDKVYLRGNNPEGLSSEDLFCTFQISGQTAASGSIMSLIDGVGSSTEIPKPYCFHQLFTGCNTLTSAPELPATTLDESCYESMFAGCTSLEKAPVLPAESLPENCYTNMFNGCSNLSFVEIGATSWEDNSTDQWLDNVANEGIFIHPNCNNDYSNLIGYEWEEYVLPSNIEVPEFMTIDCENKKEINGKTYYPYRAEIIIKIKAESANKTVFQKVYYENNDGTDTKEETIKANEQGVYTFTMPAGNTSLRMRQAYIKTETIGDTSGYCSGQKASIEIEYDGDMDLGNIYSIETNGDPTEYTWEKTGTNQYTLITTIPENHNSGSQRYNIIFQNGDIRSNPIPVDIKCRVSNQEIIFLYNDVIFISNNDGNNQPKYTSFNWKVNGESVSTAQFYEPAQHENLLEAVTSKTKDISLEVTTIDGQWLKSCPISQIKTLEAPSIAKKSRARAQVYPNPATPEQTITIQLANLDEMTVRNYKIMIFNNMGNMIKEIPECNEYNKITMPLGAYTGVATNGIEKITFRIMVR